MNRHIKSATDLETTYEATRAGFLEIALRKNKEALPYVNGAKALRAIAGGYSMKKFVSAPENYLALGELKGGIDPAGADEHWKTANTALHRIRTSFAAAHNPVQTFFVGGAIEASMAQEIFNQCKKGELGSAANLTNEDQLSELCAWVIAL